MVVKVAKKGCFPLFCIGDVHAEIESVEAQATKFMCIAYGKVAESCNSMTECRVKMWLSKPRKSCESSVKLCSIPPTTEAFTENVHRCHLQVAIWKAALLESPELDSTKHGWELDHMLSWFREQCILVHCLHRRTYYSSFAATAKPLGVALQHVAARKLSTQSSVYVRVRKPVKIL